MTAQIYYNTEKGGERMKIEITGSAKEIVALALELQKRQPLNALPNDYYEKFSQQIEKKRHLLQEKERRFV